MKTQSTTATPQTLEQRLATAKSVHQSGDFAQAGRMYGEILRTSPSNPEALYLAGAVAYQTGRFADAAAFLESSLAARPGFAPAVEMLAAASAALGDNGKALTHFRHAVQLSPTSHAAHLNLGRILMQMNDPSGAATAFQQAVDLSGGAPETCLALAQANFAQNAWPEAERWCRACLAAKPQHPEGLVLLANCLRCLARWPEAEAAYTAAIAVTPDRADLHDQFGAVLFAQGKLEDAEDAVRRAAGIGPDQSHPHTHLGHILLARGDAAGALALHDKALALDARSSEAHNNRGLALLALNRPADALRAFDQALALQPGLAEGHNNRGNALIKLLRMEESLAAYRRAIALRHGYAEAHWNLALALLMLGDFAEGWREYAWRWQCPDYPSAKRPFPAPEWDGTMPDRGKLLVWSELGIGEEIMFSGMIPDLLARSVSVVLECDARLVPLFRRSFPSAEVVGRKKKPEPRLLASDITAQIPAGSLGQWFRPSPSSFPQRAGHLAADENRRDAFRSALARTLDQNRRPLVVGLSWISKNPDFGTHKSTALADWAPILACENAVFVDLQYGETAGARADVKEALGIDVHRMEDLDHFADLDGLAALVAACDLVITVSNTTAHVAGALGIPLWVLTPAGAGQLWYWQKDGTSCPQYPSARIFRQSRFGDWSSPIAEAADALAAHAAARAAESR